MAVSSRVVTVRTWLTSLLLGVVLLGLGGATFAQFQVSQRASWTPLSWTLESQGAGPQLKAQLQSGLEVETVRNPNILGQILHITAPALGLDDTFVAGQGILPTDDVRVASNIKPFVAAAALKLMEDGRLSLDAPIAPYLSDPVATILQKAGQKIDVISLRHLLSHSSGLADYGSSKVFQALAYVPTAFGFGWHWTAQDQIWFAANLTQKKQVGLNFDYSDTNYLVAADMIAKATQTDNPGLALRALLDWPAIGAASTFWEYYEPTPPKTRRIRQFRGAIEDTHIDVSFDQYGGGGLVMSMADLARAHRAVVRGDIYANRAATVAIMQTPSLMSGANGYSLGLAPIIIEGETCWSHGGRWGTHALHCPRIDLTIARSWGQSNAGPDPLAPGGVTAGLVKAARSRAISNAE